MSMARVDGEGFQEFSPNIDNYQDGSSSRGQTRTHGVVIWRLKAFTV
jgi:hypothetical protein